MILNKIRDRGPHKPGVLALRPTPRDGVAAEKVVAWGLLGIV